jgi:O-antigen ligase
MIDAMAPSPPRTVFMAMGIGAYAALIAVTPSLAWSCALLAPLVLALLAWWTLAQPHRWTAAFIATAVLLPPLPIVLGNSGPHPSLLFAGFGLAAGALYLRRWRIASGWLTGAFLFLLFVLLSSICAAALYSGPEVAAASLIRVLLFSIGIYAFFYTASVPGSDGLLRVPRLFWMASLSALIACIDFYYQLPAPAGFGPQFIWLQTGVYRRAQGIFYEASTLGNFCTFFLVMIAVAFTRRREEISISRPALLVGGTLFSAALIFSYSRASILSLLIALAALAWTQRKHVRWIRAVPLLAVSVSAGAAGSYYFLPDRVDAFWFRLSGSALFFADYTEAIFSGRFESWRILLDFLAAHPWHAILGVGYKTLPYSEFIGQTVIADNMYLSMLVETGIVGLAALVALNFAILYTARRASRHADPNASFFGTWMFCFWVGQSFQMLSADLLTYWRVLPVYLVVLAWAVRASSQTPAQ